MSSSTSTSLPAAITVCIQSPTIEWKTLNDLVELQGDELQGDEFDWESFESRLLERMRTSSHPVDDAVDVFFFRPVRGYSSRIDSLLDRLREDFYTRFSPDLMIDLVRGIHTKCWSLSNFLVNCSAFLERNIVRRLFETSRQWYLR